MNNYNHHNHNHNHHDNNDLDCLIYIKPDDLPLIIYVGHDYLLTYVTMYTTAAKI